MMIAKTLPLFLLTLTLAAPWASAAEPWHLSCANEKGHRFSLEAQSVFQFAESNGLSKAIIDGREIPMGCDVTNPPRDRSFRAPPAQDTKSVSFHCGTFGYVGQNIRYEVDGYRSDKAGGQFVVTITSYDGYNNGSTVSELKFPVSEMKCTE